MKSSMRLAGVLSLALMPPSVFAGQPGLVSMTPASLTTSGPVTTSYSFVVSDTDGPGDLMGMDVLFASGGNPPFCWFFYNQSSNQISIYDANNQWVYGTVGQEGSQGGNLYGKSCGINVQAASVSRSGNELTLTIPITLAGINNYQCYGSCKPPAYPVYMDAINNAGVDTRYQQMGTWTPASSQSPFFGIGAAPVYSYAPGGGSDPYAAMAPGGSVSYTITVTDSSGFNAPLNFSLSPAPNGSEVTATISPSTLTGSGTATLTLHSSVSSPVHSGGVTVTASTSDNSISASMGVYYSVVNAPPTVSIDSTTLSGSSATPHFLITDENVLDIIGANVLINSSLDGQHACWVWYDDQSNYIWLANDDASVWNGMVLNSANTLQNSQCAINGSGSSIAFGGGTRNLAVNISLKPGFSGVKAIYERAPNLAGFDSGYQQVGTWTAP